MTETTAASTPAASPPRSAFSSPASEAKLPDGSTHSAHFNSAFQTEFTQFNIALASQPDTPTTILLPEGVYDFRRPPGEAKARLVCPSVCAEDPEKMLYTVLVPAYRESAVMPKLLGNLRAIEYPREKLDVKLLLEGDDDETIEQAQRHATDNHDIGHVRQLASASIGQRRHRAVPERAPLVVAVQGAIGHQRSAASIDGAS